MLDTNRYRCDFGSSPPFPPSAVFETSLQQAKMSNELLLLSVLFHLLEVQMTLLLFHLNETLRKRSYFHFCIANITCQGCGGHF